MEERGCRKVRMNRLVHNGNSSSILSSFILSILLFALSSCGSSDEHFRIEGKFKNMNQAQFYLYNAENGQKDTIHVQNGRFKYERAVSDSSTLMLIFPNYSEMPLFIGPSIVVKIKGDASHLRATEVTGSDENEDMTAFRLKVNQLTPPETQKAAIAFIEKQPESPVSLYLLKHYFISSSEADAKEAYRLCRLMQEARPANGELVRLLRQLKDLKSCSVGSRLPHFAFKTVDGKIVTNKQLRSKVNIICLWSSWNRDSRALILQARRIRKSHPKEVAVLGICIDASANEGKDFLKRDTIDVPVICDGRMWQSPIVQKMGFATVPSSIIADKDGRVLKRDILDTKALREETEKLLK